MTEDRIKDCEVGSWNALEQWQPDDVAAENWRGIGVRQRSTIAIASAIWAEASPFGFHEGVFEVPRFRDKAQQIASGLGVSGLVWGGDG